MTVLIIPALVFAVLAGDLVRHGAATSLVNVSPAAKSYLIAHLLCLAVYAQGLFRQLKKRPTAPAIAFLVTANILFWTNASESYWRLLEVPPLYLGGVFVVHDYCEGLL